MTKAKDRYVILQNIIAKAGGIDKVDLHSELAKSENILNSMKAMSDMDEFNALQSQNNSTLTGQQPVEPQNSLGDQSKGGLTGLSPDQTGESMPAPGIM